MNFSDAFIQSYNQGLARNRQQKKEEQLNKEDQLNKLVSLLPDNRQVTQPRQVNDPSQLIQLLIDNGQDTQSAGTGNSLYNLVQQFNSSNPAGPSADDAVSDLSLASLLPAPAAEMRQTGTDPHGINYIDAMIAKNPDGTPVTDEQGYLVFKPGATDGNFGSQLTLSNKAPQGYSQDTRMALQASAAPQAAGAGETVLEPGQGSSEAGKDNPESNSDALSGADDISPIPPTEVGDKMGMSTSTRHDLKAAGSAPLDASGEYALDRASKGEGITLPGGRVIPSEALKTYGEATKGISLLLDAKEAKEYGEKVFQEAKSRDLSDEDADGIAHRAVMNYLGLFKLPERGGQALLGAFGFVPALAGIGLGEFAEHNFQDNIKDYFMNRAIKEYMTDKENWQNFKAPDPSAYYNRTR